MGASVCLTAGGVAVISVRIAYDNLVVDLDFDSEQYSPDLVDDMTTRCATAVAAAKAVMA